VKITFGKMFRATKCHWHVEASTLGWAAGYFPPTMTVEDEVYVKSQRVNSPDGEFVGYSYVAEKDVRKSVFVVND
jgi:hypothetical protein